MSSSTPYPITIRVATPDDAAALVAIYRPYVERTAITFEYDVPSVDEFSQRIANTLKLHPYLVAIDADNNILGYAYASPLKERVAYDWAVELSVYLAPSARQHGIGSQLYQALTDILLSQRITTLYACITYSKQEDKQHDNSSVHFHEHLGFRQVAHFHECGYKFQRWWDILWLEKHIAPRLPQQLPFIPFSQLINN